METDVVTEPPIDEPLVVSYGNCECLGYLDAEGTWREWYTDKKIEDVIGWAPLEPDL